MTRRGFSILLSAFLLAGVGVVLIWGRDGGSGPGSGPAVVRGVIGSEKIAFFEDEAVQAAFAEHGLSVEVDPAGSRQIGTTVDLGQYDFAFSGSGPTAEKVQREHDIKESYAPFHTPMAIAAYESIVEVLVTEGIARQEQDGTWTFDMAAFMELASEDRRWDQLEDKSYPVRKNVLVRTTDPRNSNSGVMYLALTSHIANGSEVVRSEAEEQAVLPAVMDLFLKQGFAGTSSDFPFVDYLSQGVGNTPMLFIYEASFIERLVRDDGSIVTGQDDPNRNMVLLYPSPTVVSNHTLVPLNDEGHEVGRLLSEDPRLQVLAAEHGFRTLRPEHFATVVGEHVQDGPVVRGTVVDVVDLPAYETLERMLLAIEQEYRAEGLPEAPENEDEDTG